jgi:hypothetical protein
MFRTVAAVLITGNPGSGKTTMVAELTRLGYAAVDADDHIARWENGPEGRTWVWDRPELEHLIQRLAPGPAFVCGIALNQRDMLEVFDHIFLLALDEETQVRRLTVAGDRQPALRKPIVDGRPVFEDEMRAVGAEALDGRLPTATLAAQIVERLDLPPTT